MSQQAAGFEVLTLGLRFERKALLAQIAQAESSSGRRERKVVKWQNATIRFSIENGRLIRTPVTFPLQNVMNLWHSYHSR